MCPYSLPSYNISLEDERELALQRLKAVCDNDFHLRAQLCRQPVQDLRCSRAGGHHRSRHVHQDDRPVQPVRRHRAQARHQEASRQTAQGGVGGGWRWALGWSWWGMHVAEKAVMGRDVGISFSVLLGQQSVGRAVTPNNERVTERVDKIFICRHSKASFKGTNPA